MIEAGTKLGSYEIRSKLGEGGMGEVYRAQDTKLGRDVAIKVLSASLSENVERLNRFEQEAQAAGALNHPNILSIYHIGTHDGAPYIVSELLEGETLRERIADAALSQRKAIDYGLQIAKGLAAAHDKGIVHRDMKPDNIFITDDGRVKILDFGLAKLTAAIDGTQPQTDVPTRKVKTDPGTVMGTMGYMSPEQLKGQHIDHRSDIFSFGAILYEMLSGKRAFRGDSRAETMSAILREDPPDLSETNKTVSPALERVVRHCLEKNPAERFQSARDLGFDLESISVASGTSKTEIIVEPTRAKRPVRLALAGLGLALLVLGTVAGILISRRLWETSPPTYRKLTFRLGTVWSARFAPDGKTIVYSAAWNGNPIDIFTTQPETTEARSLGLANTDLLSISASGEMAVLLNRRFLSHLLSRGTLARLPLAGGAPREVLEDVEQADWSPDGKELAVVRWADGRRRLEYPIGNVLYETAGYITSPRVSPRGDLVAFLDHQVPGDNRGWVAVVDSTGRKTVLTGEWGGEEGLAWSPAGDEVWFSASKEGEDYTLYAVTLQGRQRAVARGAANAWLRDVARDGRVLLASMRRGRFITGLAPGETKERDLSWLDDTVLFDLSDDGKEFVFANAGEGSGTNYAAYLRKTDGSPAVRLGEGTATAISPDGKRVLTFLYNPPQLVLLPTGAGETTKIERAGIEYYLSADWLPDGKRIIFTGREPGRGLRCYVQDLAGGPPRAVTPEGTTPGKAIEYSIPVSPDGRFFAALDAQERHLIFSVEGGQGRPIPGIADDDRIIRWTGDGRALFVAQGTLITKIYRLDLTTGRRELWKEITPADPAGINSPLRVLLTPDGKWYVYALYRQLSDLYLVEGLK